MHQTYSEGVLGRDRGSRPMHVRIEDLGQEQDPVNPSKEAHDAHYALEGLWKIVESQMPSVTRAPAAT